MAQGHEAAHLEKEVGQREAVVDRESIGAVRSHAPRPWLRHREQQCPRSAETEGSCAGAPDASQ